MNLVIYLGLLAGGSTVLAAVALAEIGAKDSMLEALTILFQTARLPAVAPLEVTKSLIFL